MSKILGLDLGTNSIGWAIRDANLEGNQVVDTNVLVFPQGVGEEKGVEFSLASERTKHRASRKLYRRRKKRKTDLLRLLIENGFCPLSLDELDIWSVYKKGREIKYPTENYEFSEWLKINPYKVRAKGANSIVSKQELGRALYHICQRRGFKSGRKDADAGKDLEQFIKEKELLEQNGFKTLGEYYYDLLKNDKKVRKTKFSADDQEVNSSRISYVEEFNFLMKSQNIDKDLANKFFDAIFFQRPLKSQKGTVGKCTLEKIKPRCPVSHPLFEEFRMYQFLNSIKVKERKSDSFVFLSDYPEYYQIALNKFYRVSAKSFKFLDISKGINTLAKKNNLYFEFNYKDKYPIVGSPTISKFIKVFDADNWKECKSIIKSKYKKQDNKTVDELVDELWHTLFFAGDFVNDVTSEKVKKFIKDRFEISEEKVSYYESINLKQGYSSLSKKVISKILPFLKEDKIIYPYAVFFANIDEIIGKDKWNENKQFIQDTIIDIISGYKEKTLKIDIVNGLVGDFIKEYDNSHYDYVLDDTDKKNVTEKIIAFYGKYLWEQMSNSERDTIKNDIEVSFQKQLQKRRHGGYYLSKPRVDEIIKDFLIQEFKIFKEEANKLYHPSAMDAYPQSQDGLLGLPFTNAVKNPMAMRTLFYLRKLINTLLKENKITSDTEIIIELARELNDKNKRLAIERWQRERESENKKFKEKLEELAKDTNSVVTETDIVKYRLYQEQNGVCLYTNNTINCEKLLGSNPQFEIEHTFPRSKSFDNSLANKTLADKGINQIKGNRIPQDLEYEYKQNCISNTRHWKTKIEELDEKIEQQKYFSKVASTVEQKNRAIQQRHYLKLKLDYWKQKLYRFTATEIKPNFKNSQLVDTGIITKYSTLFLKSLFQRVFPAKGTMVADVRKSWGLDTKDRNYHYHHAIDAVVLTCMDKSIREGLTVAFNEVEKLGDKEKFKIEKPWKTFTEDTNRLKDSIIVVHNHKDNIERQTKRKLRKRNKIQYNTSGNVMYEKGQGIRGSLHKDTFYGAIERENEKSEKEIWFVLRKPVNSSFLDKDVKSIVDEGIKSRILKHGLKNIRTEEGWILLPHEKDENGNQIKEMLIKRIRVKTNNKNLPKIKAQSHVSRKNRKAYKESYYATLENIFAMAIYETVNDKGKRVLAFKTISAFDLAKHNQGNPKLEMPVEDNIIKNQGKKNEVLLPLSKVLRVNQMAIFYENSPNELKNISRDDLSKRLFKITQFEGDGRIQFRHHAQGGADKDLKKESLLNFDKSAQKLRISLSNVKAIFEGSDFVLSKTGSIDFLI
ncbi:HNH endonuclease domain-containing protein [Flavivirga amylovorans]|uniref:CRISPR-associated endonuclease Cas9 n=1 Tax=Flavivirga amylovorans TaxID=870486 RepID=A0ABT8X2W2_9FLAO|nr:type II CRISPR RNA-guided endonuclease Cas9 [Flavivirga amylovorans]MDO5988197.1 HNH endonuclease domain-containing protein [Flavivirga amylovorans]